MSESTPQLPAHLGVLFPGPQHLHNDIYPAINAETNSSLAQPGKVVLVTGAGRGIGRAIATQYAHAGVASIIILARTGSELDEVEATIKKINSQIRVHKHIVDVTDAAAVQKCAEAVTAAEKRLDVLVNNAGGSAPFAPLADGDADAWWNGITINLKGPYLLTRAFLPLLVASAKQHSKTVDIVNLSSIGAHMLAPGASSYQISKLAVLRLTEFVDFEYRSQGVNCVAVHPGGVVTKLSGQEPTLKPFLNDTAELAGGWTVWLTKGERTWLAGRYISANWDVERLEQMKDEIVDGDKLKVRMVV